MGRQIARSVDVVFCLTFAQLGSIGDERNVSKGSSIWNVCTIVTSPPQELLIYELFGSWVNMLSELRLIP